MYVIHVLSIKMVNIHFQQVNLRKGQSTGDCPEIGMAKATKFLLHFNSSKWLIYTSNK